MGLRGPGRQGEAEEGQRGRFPHRVTKGSWGEPGMGGKEGRLSHCREKKQEIKIIQGFF